MLRKTLYRNWPTTLKKQVPGFSYREFAPNDSTFLIPGSVDPCSIWIALVVSKPPGAKTGTFVGIIELIYFAVDEFNLSPIATFHLIQMHLVNVVIE